MRVCQRQRRHLCESLREWLLIPPFTRAFLKSPSSRGLSAIAELLVYIRLRNNSNVVRKFGHFRILSRFDIHSNNASSNDCPFATLKKKRGLHSENRVFTNHLQLSDGDHGQRQAFWPKAIRSISARKSMKRSWSGDCTRRFGSTHVVGTHAYVNRSAKIEVNRTEENRRRSYG